MRIYFSSFFFLFITNNAICGGSNTINTDKQQCPHLADFYYEIVMCVSTFPQQALCSQEEEAEISALLEKTINAELETFPGTVKTKNKICGNPINHRRSLIPLHESGETSRSLLRLVHPKQQRILLHRRLYRRRSFIYIGGGKCRFCLNDNFDHRTLASPALLPAKEDKHNGRNLLFLYSRRTPNPITPKVADISLCKMFHPTVLYFDPAKSHQQIKWINAKKTEFLDRKTTQRRENLLGPYKAGQQFGIQLDMSHAMRRVDKNPGIDDDDAKISKYPIKEGKIHFWLWAFDLPEAFTTGILADDPLYIFINGIKLDLNVLLTQPGVNKRTTLNMVELWGSSFAGIEWNIKHLTSHDRDFAYGPERDKIYWITITAPLFVLSHVNQLDVDFIVKPNAKAKHYIFGHLTVELNAALCEVTGMEDSPFEEFQSIVESRLFHKLGLGLAKAFQRKEGHCMYDKIPVVNVHLVEKNNWNDSNPQCSVIVDES